MTELAISVYDNMIAIALAFVRLAPFMIVPTLTPLSRVPAQARIFLALVVAVAATQLFDTAGDFAGITADRLVLEAAAQLMLGMALAIGYQAMMAAILTIGRALDLQMGFGAAGVLDPTTQNSESMLGTLLMWLIFMLTVHLGLHYEILAALLISFQVYPLGAELPMYDAGVLLMLMGEQFLLAMLMALPVIVTLLIFDIMLGVTAKSMPQMNVYFVMLPLKMFVGILALSVTAATMGSGIAEIFTNLRQYWLNLLAT